MASGESESSLKEYFEFVKNESQKVYGWICGKCGRSNAPNVSQCPCSNHYPIQPWPQPSDPPQRWTPMCQSEGIHLSPNQCGQPPYHFHCWTTSHTSGLS